MRGGVDIVHNIHRVMFHIVASGYNCEAYAAKLVRSVLSLQNHDWHLHLINDGSTDRTNQIINTFVCERITVYSHTENKGAAFRRWEVIHLLPGNDIVLLIGLDDELFPDCLDVVQAQYDKGVWMTYGNWVNQHGNMLPDGFLFFDDETHANRDYRKVQYRSTGPNTFYKFLFDKIPVEDFQLNGKWIDSTTESELMFSCLEMCGRDRIGVIEQAICLYNENRLGGSLNRLGRAYKMSIYNQVIQRPKKPLFEYL